MADKIKIDKSTTLVPFGENFYKTDKLFLSAVKEEEWLNMLAQHGYVLVFRQISGYIFERNGIANKYYYSVRVFPVPADAESSVVAIKSRIKGDLFYTYGNKAYFKTAFGDIGDDIAEDASSKRRHLRNLFAFNFSVLCFWLGLLCYNLIYWVRFDSATVVDTEKSGLMWKCTIDMSFLFGDHPTTPYISLFIVLTLIFLPFAVYFLDQYLYSRCFEKRYTELWERE